MLQFTQIPHNPWTRLTLVDICFAGLVLKVGAQVVHDINTTHHHQERPELTSHYSTSMLAITAERAGDVCGHRNYIPDGTHGGRCAHPSSVLTHGKMRGRERQHPGLVSASSDALTPGTAQSPHLVEDRVAGRLSVWVCVCVCVRVCEREKVGQRGWQEAWQNGWKEWGRGKLICRERVWVTDLEAGVVEVVHNNSRRTHTHALHKYTHMHILCYQWLHSAPFRTPLSTVCVTFFFGFLIRIRLKSSLLVVRLSLTGTSAPAKCK